MITENTGIPYKRLQLLEKFSSKWLNNKEVKFIDLIIESNSFNDKLYWDDPENIESGLSGVALVFIEIFRKTNDRKYFNLVEDMVDQLISYSKETPTNNYSLFTGRSGVVYAILQFHSLSRNNYLLDAALDIIKPAKLTFLDSKYVNDSLYEGRAGTLLTLYNLYELAQDPSLLEDIRLFTDKIIKNASLSAEGIHWENAEEFNIKPLCGFARGTAGIKYVLNRMKDFIPSDVLKYMSIKISIYEDSCWIEEFNNWGDFYKGVKDPETLAKYRFLYDHNDLDSLNTPLDNLSWGKGTAGIGISKLLCKADDNENFENNIRQITRKLKTALKNGQIEKNNLHEGLAGTGCFFLVAGDQLPDEGYLETAIEIADEISTHLSNKSEFSNGLIYGDLGCLYFLLLMTKPERHQECVLYPCSNFRPDIKIDHNIDLYVSSIRRDLLEPYFIRTIYLLEKITPRVYLKFFSKTIIEYTDNDIEYFVKFMEIFFVKIAGSPIADILSEIFHFENEKYLFLTSRSVSSLQLYISGLVRNDEVNNLLNRSQDGFENMTLIRSKDVKRISTKWMWSRNDYAFEAGELKRNLYRAPEQLETIFYTSYEKGVVENGVDFTVTFCWHRFKEKTNVKQALAEIKSYCNNLGLEEIMGLVKASVTDSLQDRRNRLYLNTVYKVKELMYNGVLVIVN